MDNEVCPTQNPNLLLRFDRTISEMSARPVHTNDIIDIIRGSKTWLASRTSWHMKVRSLFRHLGIEYPTTKNPI